ncbi:MAG: hypothetical protein WBQ23_14720 [Bacteroidota bacterium]
MKQPRPVQQVYSYKYPPPISGILAGIVFVLGFVFTLTGVVVAQTEWKDRYVSIARNHQLNPAIAYPTQAGSTVTVWEDERDLDSLGSDIYIQSVDNGNGVSQWVGPNALVPGLGYNDIVTDRFDGIAVCKAEFDQRNPRAAYDGMGGVIVVWEDYRNDPMNTVADIYAQRIVIATGRQDPAWPIDGIPVCQTGSHNERPRIVGTVDGAFITWIDYRNDPGTTPRDRDVFVQYIQSATASWPPPPTNWVANGICVPTNQRADQTNPELDSDNIFTLDILGQLTQGVVVTYQDDRYIGNYSGLPVWTVFANRIDANGVQMYTMGTPPWTADVAAGPSNENQEYPRIVTTGKRPTVTNQSAVIVWQDMIDDPTQGWTDIYSQCLDQFGMPQFPGPNGLMVCQAPSSQVIPQPTLWESGDPLLGTYIPYVTVGWLDYRNYAQSGIDIYGGLIDARAPGMMMNPAGPAGEPICVLPYDQTQLSMDNVKYNSHTSEQTVFVWTHPTGVGLDIREQKIALPPWIESWPVNGWPVTEAKSDQVLPQANREVFVWQDGRRDPIPNDNQDDENIYCQTPGMCTGPTEMNWRDMFAKWTFGEDARDFRYVSDPSDGSTYIVWVENRHSDPDWSNVFIQKLDKDGVPRWSNNGVVVNNYYPNLLLLTTDVQLPDVCIDGQGGAWVIWQQKTRTSGIDECPMRHIDAQGGLGIFALAGKTWNVPPNNYYGPRVLTDGAGGGVVGAIEDDGVGNRRPYAVKFDNFGVVANGQTILTGGYRNHSDLRVGFDGANNLYTMTRADSSNITSIVLAQYYYTSAIYSYASIQYSSFGGYDLNHQDSRMGAGTPALFTYSISTGLNQPYNVYLGQYQNGPLAFTQPVTAHAAGSGYNSTMPAISPDSVVSQVTNKQGFLLAWDTDYLVPPNPLYHKVETDRYKVTSGVYPNLTATAEFGTPIVLASGLSAATYPDIARVTNPSPNYGPFGVVVWEGGGESSQCNPARPTEIYGQYVLYDAAAMYPGTQWTQAEMIGPGAGNYQQTHPIVNPGLPNSVSVYWYDSQTGNKGIMGTRLPELDGAIAWAKNPERHTEPKFQTTLSITGIWPQPASINTSAIQVGITGRQLEDVTLDVFDLLGRKIATLYRGLMHETGLVVQFTPSELELRSGVYVLRLHGDSQQVTKTFTVLR